MPVGDDVDAEVTVAAGTRAVRRPPRRRRRWIAVTAAAVLVPAGLLVGPFAYARASVAVHLHGDTASAPSAPVAIVFGAGLTGSGTPSPFLAQRIQVAVDLYRAKRVRALLMSGDNSRTDHDEVGAMAAAAQRLGVPASAIVSDHAGFDTYSSCWRARRVWGVTRAVVVTQPFHLTRAVWTCRHLGVDADGVATTSSFPDVTRQGWVREVPAVDKAILDVVRHRTPRFPGPREHGLDAVTGAAR